MGKILRDIYSDISISSLLGLKGGTAAYFFYGLPCCGGLLGLAQKAVAEAGRKIPLKLVVIGIKGDVLKEEWT